MSTPDANSKLNKSITVLSENVRTGVEEVSRTLAERVAALLNPVFERIAIQDSYIEELTSRIEALEQERVSRDLPSL